MQLRNGLSGWFFRLYISHLTPGVTAIAGEFGGILGVLAIRATVLAVVAGSAATAWMSTFVLCLACHGWLLRVR
jgi:hypothetical protein